MPQTGSAPAVPIGESRDPSRNTAFEGLGDLNINLTLGGKGAIAATIAPEDSGESNPVLDQTMDEVVDELADEGNQALAEEAREIVEEWAFRKLQAAYSAWLALMGELAGPPPQFNYELYVESCPRTPLKRIDQMIRRVEESEWVMNGAAWESDVTREELNAWRKDWKIPTDVRLHFRTQTNLCLAW